MRKFITQRGHIAYAISFGEIQSLGGIGVCDTCNQLQSEGYLVPVLASFLCPACFGEFEQQARVYPEEIPDELRRAAYYESCIPVEGR